MFWMCLVKGPRGSPHHVDLGRVNKREGQRRKPYRENGNRRQPEYDQIQRQKSELQHPREGVESPEPTLLQSPGNQPGGHDSQAA